MHGTPTPWRNAKKSLPACRNVGILKWRVEKYQTIFEKYQTIFISQDKTTWRSQGLPPEDQNEEEI